MPLDHVPTPADQHLAEGAELILAAYEERRPRLTDTDDIVEVLLRLNERFEHLVIMERSCGDEETIVSDQTP